MLRARASGVGVPAFNIPYLPMMQPVTKAVKDADAFSLIEVARLEWMKFESKSLAAVAEEFGWHVEAWAVFSNHYHFVGYSPGTGAQQWAKRIMRFPTPCT